MHRPCHGASTRVALAQDAAVAVASRRGAKARPGWGKATLGAGPDAAGEPAAYVRGAMTIPEGPFPNRRVHPLREAFALRTASNRSPATRRPY